MFASKAVGGRYVKSGLVVSGVAEGCGSAELKVASPRALLNRIDKGEIGITLGEGMLGESVDCCLVTRRNMISIRMSASFLGFARERESCSMDSVKRSGMQEIQLDSNSMYGTSRRCVHPLYIWTPQLGTTI